MPALEQVTASSEYCEFRVLMQPWLLQDVAAVLFAFAVLSFAEDRLLERQA